LQQTENEREEKSHHGGLAGEIGEPEWIGLSTQERGSLEGLSAARARRKGAGLLVGCARAGDEEATNGGGGGGRGLCVCARRRVARPRPGAAAPATGRSSGQIKEGKKEVARLADGEEREAGGGLSCAGSRRRRE